MVGAEPDQVFKLVVTPEQVVVDNGDGTAQVFTAPPLSALLRAAIYGRSSPDTLPG